MSTSSLNTDSKRYDTPVLHRYGRIEHVTLSNGYSQRIDKTFADPDFMTNGITVNGATVGDRP